MNRFGHTAEPRRSPRAVRLFWSREWKKQEVSERKKLWKNIQGLFQMVNIYAAVTYKDLDSRETPGTEVFNMWTS